MPQLNKDQIQEIKKFIHSRGFTHIEVELEILDHVASAVEQKLENDPQKPLDKAIKEVHAGFGVFGFAGIEEEKQKLISSLLKKEYQNVMLSYFKTSKVLIVALIALLYTASLNLSWLMTEQVLRFFPVCVVLALLIYTAAHYRWRYRKIAKRSLMVSSAMLPMALIPNLANITGMWLEDVTGPNAIYIEYLYVAIMTLCTLVFLAMNDVIKWSYQWTYDRYLKFE